MSAPQQKKERGYAGQSQGYLKANSMIGTQAGRELCEPQSGRNDIFVIGRGRRAALGAELVNASMANRPCEA